MENNKYRNSSVEDWIRRNNMTTKQFCELVNCSRITAWKLKRNLCVTPDVADRIEALTNGEVQPRRAPKGRRW